MDGRRRTYWSDVGWVGLFSLILFGFAGFSGRPLTMHEARLPQTSREMLQNHHWLLPTSGGRPWLERPPLPHWIVIASMKLFGHVDRVWIVRLPSAVMGTLTVLLAIYIASRWFGQEIGLITGLLLATSLKFYQYSTLAEDDIYLAMLVALAAALFTQAELLPLIRINRFGFFALRRWAICLFFIVLGLSNLTKGPLLGILILGSAVGIFLCLRSRIEQSLQPLYRYTWLWGWILLLGLTLAWPLWAYRHVPDVVENWRYDYVGRISGVYSAINQPWWYYPPNLALALLPWTPICLLGVWIALKNRLNVGYQWILCWALVPLAVLSIPKGKHDHYLVPFLAPWATLGAIGVVEIGKRLRAGRKTLIAIALLLALSYSSGEAMFAAQTDHTVDDTAFLLRCRNEVPENCPLYIDGKLGPPGNLDFFRMQFYSRPNAILLHNLTFLRDNKITTPIVYVIARQRDVSQLSKYGRTQQIDQSPKSHDLDTPAGRFTLFKLSFDPALQRYPAPTYISSMQAMERTPGPLCGPEDQ
jgi:4-amino-4-deoxy-L-arabinose transferase-like glycosyltransferase